jgi:hypothetical protein
MSQSYGRQDETYMANADLTPYQFRFAVMTAEYTVGLAGANVRAIGVIQDIPVQGKAGAPSAIRRTGTSKIVAGAAFAAGVPLTSDATGRAVQATAGQYINGYALEAATAAGDVVETTVELAGTV